MKKILALAAALVLLPALFACGALTPAQPNTVIDLASFADAPLAFDLTDLARFLNPSQIASLESSLRTGLADRGLADYATLHFADPPEDSIKIPFGNESGADLSNLNTGQLARHICGQVEEAFEDRGVVVGTTGATVITVIDKSEDFAGTTTTKAATENATTTQRQTTTTTTTKATTTTKKPSELTPQTLELSPNQIVDVNDFGVQGFWEYPNGFNLRFTANGKTYLFHRDASYHTDEYFENTFKAGAKETVGFYVRTGTSNGKEVYRLLTTRTYTVNTIGAPAGYQVYIVANPNDKIEHPRGGQGYSSINISVGHNVGLLFTYHILNELYISLSEYPEAVQLWLYE